MADRGGASTASEVGLPPVVYLPMAGVPAGNGEGSVELRRLDDGRLALPAYSSMDRLIGCCGEHQPWVLMRTTALAQLRAQRGYDVVALDVPLPEELRHVASEVAADG